MHKLHINPKQEKEDEKDVKIQIEMNDYKGRGESAFMISDFHHEEWLENWNSIHNDYDLNLKQR